MHCPSSLLLFIALAAVQQVVASASPPNDEDRHEIHRRYLTEEETECVLYLRASLESEDEDEAEEVKKWTCEFTREQQEKFGIPIGTIEIDGVPDELLASAVSGETILKFKDGIVIQPKQDSGVIVVSGRSEGSIRAQSVSSFQVQSMSSKDPRLFRNARRTTGNFRTLVVRVIDSYNKQGESASQLRSEIFYDSFNMKTQLNACSHGQMTIEEAGVVDIKVNAPIESNIDNSDYAALAKSAAEQKYGGSVGLGNKYDLVMFCFPPSSRDFAAFAYIGRWDSYYNYGVCSRPGTQQHEIGHNLGLGHSRRNGEEYGDRSTTMGRSYVRDDGPGKCFNPANNYQLRWYEQQQLSIKPIELSSPQTFVLNGVDDYKRWGSSGGKLVVLRLVYYGDSHNTWDWYVGFNRASGINAGTEYANTVSLVLKHENGPYGYSKTDSWSIQLGKRLTIPRSGDDKPDVHVDFKCLENNGKDAIVVVSNSYHERSRCGCNRCTEQVWNTVVDGYSCGDRINWVVGQGWFDMAGSCRFVTEEFPSVCTCTC